jgi:hypothetical protein
MKSWDEEILTMSEGKIKKELLTMKESSTGTQFGRHFRNYETEVQFGNLQK